ncbi:hypothetical protein [Amycolatopsis sp. NPDC059657]|uniref:hypothetical protein n=1 Tax=Amycolatopsis sp. NPDC059657 TaxID=3346899 RepID=UPI00366E826E
MGELHVRAFQLARDLPLLSAQAIELGLQLGFGPPLFGCQVEKVVLFLVELPKTRGVAAPDIIGELGTGSYRVVNARSYGS